MGFFEAILTMTPTAGFAVGMGLFRRGRTSIGVGLVLAAAAVGAIAAVFGNARPILGMLAFALIMTSFVTDENRKRALALACFSAGFMTVIITAFYT